MPHLKSSSVEHINFFDRYYEESVANNVEESLNQLEIQFYKTYRSFQITAQLFLSAPMGLEKPKSNWQRRDVLRNRLHILWCLSVYALLVYCIRNETKRTMADLPPVQIPLYLSEYFIYLIQLLESMRLIYFRRDTFRHLQIGILNFDKMLLERKMPIDYEDLRQFLCLHKFLILFNFIFGVILCYFYAYFELLNFVSYLSIYVLTNLVINISLLQYYALLFLVWNRAERLQSHCNRLLNDCSSNDMIKLRQQLTAIRGLFAKLDRFTKKVNDHYSIYVCLIYLGSFINCCVNIFLLYKYFNNWGRAHTSWVVFSLTWTLLHIGKMVLILYYNQKIQTAKSKTALLLSSFKLEYPGAETTLRLFIFQLMADTRSNYVCGLLVLDMKFITSLAVAISTLFIFLVQYDITFEALTTTHHAGGRK